MFETFTHVYQTLKGALLEARVPLEYSWSANGIVLGALTGLNCPDAGEITKKVAVNSSAKMAGAKICLCLWLIFLTHLF